MSILIASVWISRFTASLSIFGSMCIIYIIYSDAKRKLSLPKSRLMFMMSIFDFFQSASLAAATAAEPRETGKYGAIGNNVTCTIQGFFVWLGLSVPLYNSSLNLFYLLTIRYGMRRDTFSRKIEPLLHFCSILLPLSAAIYNVSLVSTEPTGSICSTDGMSDSLAVFCSVIIFCFIFCVITMTAISCSVTKQANTMEQYQFRSIRRESVLSVNTVQSSRVTTDAPMEGKMLTRSAINRVRPQRRNSISTILREKETITQAKLYTIAFIMTYIFPLGMGILNSIKLKRTEDVFLILASIFYPLQGFWNFVFYVHPKVKHVRTSLHPDISFLGAVWQVISNAKFVETNYNNPSRRRREGLHDNSARTMQRDHNKRKNYNASVGISGAVLGGVNTGTAKRYSAQQFISKDCDGEDDDDNASREDKKENISPLYIQEQISDYNTANIDKDSKTFGSTADFEQTVMISHSFTTVGTTSTATDLNQVDTSSLCLQDQGSNYITPTMDKMSNTFGNTDNLEEIEPSSLL